MIKYGGKKFLISTTNPFNIFVDLRPDASHGERTIVDQTSGDQPSSLRRRGHQKEDKVGLSGQL